MEKNERSEDWQLIVNGEYKPWSVVDYMSTPITINLNWGIDTNSSLKFEYMAMRP